MKCQVFDDRYQPGERVCAAVCVSVPVGGFVGAGIAVVTGITDRITVRVGLFGVGKVRTVVVFVCDAVKVTVRPAAPIIAIRQAVEVVIDAVFAAVPDEGEELRGTRGVEWVRPGKKFDEVLKAVVVIVAVAGVARAVPVTIALIW